MAGYTKRGGARGGFKSANYKKRASPDSNDDAPAAKKAKASEEEESNEAFVPKLEVDEDKNHFVSLKSNGTRRVTISEFKGKTLVSIREYYTDKDGGMKPGKKGISLSLEQYNALLAAAPLIESVLVDKEGVEVARPNYDTLTAENEVQQEADVKQEEAKDINEEDED